MKYFVLHEEKLYFYASMKSHVGGILDLKDFIDCTEAPISDNKKASNVFFLVAKERGFFDQVKISTIEIFSIFNNYRVDTTCLPRL